jgi:hypothetical protein
MEYWSTCAKSELHPPSGLGTLKGSWSGADSLQTQLANSGTIPRSRVQFGLQRYATTLEDDDEDNYD